MKSFTIHHRQVHIHTFFSFLFLDQNHKPCEGLKPYISYCIPKAKLNFFKSLFALFFLCFILSLCYLLPYASFIPLLPSSLCFLHPSTSFIPLLPSFLWFLLSSAYFFPLVPPSLCLLLPSASFPLFPSSFTSSFPLISSSL